VSKQLQNSSVFLVLLKSIAEISPFMAEDSSVPTLVADVSTPCFLVNIDVVRRNAQNMIKRSHSLGLQLRPHMKTHKCTEIGVIATDGTKRRITVSTIREAEVFADDGFDDITYASLFTADKIGRLSRLANRLREFYLLIDSETTLKLLEENPLTDKKWSVFVKVDCGGCRGGVLWDSDSALELVRHVAASQSVTFVGLYGHEGQSYHARGVEEVKEIGQQAAERILGLANRVREAGITCRIIGLGSTPTTSHPVDVMKDLTELHPGNYLFYDVCQNVIGACALEDIAVRVGSRVIGHYPHRNQLLIDAGWTAMSLDGQGALPNGSFCLFEGEPNLRLMKMTQEVGFVEPRRGKLNYEKYPIGKLLLLYPYHSCASACLHPRYLVYSGDKIVDTYEPCRGW
jgi:D-serine deaminase-like pyridoxal phosphate-dependent protein